MSEKSKTKTVKGYVIALNTPKLSTQPYARYGDYSGKPHPTAEVKPAKAPEDSEEAVKESPSR